jgi:hypothetical protein
MFGATDEVAWERPVSGTEFLPMRLPNMVVDEVW